MASISIVARSPAASEARAHRGFGDLQLLSQVAAIVQQSFDSCAGIALVPGQDHLHVVFNVGLDRCR